MPSTYPFMMISAQMMVYRFHPSNYSTIQETSYIGVGALCKELGWKEIRAHSILVSNLFVGKRNHSAYNLKENNVTSYSCLEISSS